MEDLQVINFTQKFYQELFSGQTICTAFKRSAAFVGFAIPEGVQSTNYINNLKNESMSKFMLLLPEKTATNEICSEEYGCMSRYTLEETIAPAIAPEK